MKNDRFHGGTINKNDKEIWMKTAKEEGFQNIWSWLKWLAHHRVKGALILKPKKTLKR